MVTNNSINANSTGLAKYDGAGTWTGVTVTQHDLLIGAASNGITSVAPSATSGVPVISQGASADPAFGTAVVAGGGTGKTSFSDTNSLICSGTTTTGILQDVASVATGQVLTSAGTSTLPAWSATPTVTSITFGAGTALSTYAEGTWTPTLNFGGSTTGITYTTQLGTYTKIGRLVYVHFQITLSSKGSATGNATITGLPFTMNSSYSLGNPVVLLASITLDSGFQVMYVLTSANSTSLTLGEYSATGNAALTNTNFSNTSGFKGFITYFT